jgi:hypothetical protein
LGAIFWPAIWILVNGQNAGVSNCTFLCKHQDISDKRINWLKKRTRLNYFLSYAMPSPEKNRFQPHINK